MNPRFRQSLCVSVAVLSTVAAAGVLQTPARAMALNSFGGLGHGMNGFGHGTDGLGAGGAMNGLGGFGDRTRLRIIISGSERGVPAHARRLAPAENWTSDRGRVEVTESSTDLGAMGRNAVALTLGRATAA